LPPISRFSFFLFSFFHRRHESRGNDTVSTLVSVTVTGGKHLVMTVGVLAACLYYGIKSSQKSVVFRTSVSDTDIGINTSNSNTENVSKYRVYLCPCIKFFYKVNRNKHVKGKKSSNLCRYV